MTQDRALTLFIKFNTKWIIDLNIQSKTIKFLEKKMGENLRNLVWVIIFFHRTPKSMTYDRKKYMSCVFSKIKSCSVNEWKKIGHLSREIEIIYIKKPTGKGREGKMEIQEQKCTIAELAQEEKVHWMNWTTEWRRKSN